MPTDEVLDKAVADAFYRLTGGFVTGYFTIVQGVDKDGDQFLEWFLSEGIKTWHLRGWLHEALATQLAGQTADLVTDE